MLKSSLNVLQDPLRKCDEHFKPRCSLEENVVKLASQYMEHLTGNHFVSSFCTPLKILFLKKVCPSLSSFSFKARDWHLPQFTTKRTVSDEMSAVSVVIGNILFLFCQSPDRISGRNFGRKLVVY